MADVIPQEEPRGWVVRLGSYLRIFGIPREGWEEITPREGGITLIGTPQAYLDSLIRMAQRRERDLSGRKTG